MRSKLGEKFRPAVFVVSRRHNNFLIETQIEICAATLNVIRRPFTHYASILNTIKSCRRGNKMLYIINAEIALAARKLPRLFAQYLAFIPRAVFLVRPNIKRVRCSTLRSYRRARKCLAGKIKPDHCRSPRWKKG